MHTWSAVVHVCIMHLYCSNCAVRMERLMLLLQRTIVRSFGEETEVVNVAVPS